MVRDALAILGTFFVLAVICGVLWWVLVDPASYTLRAGGGSMSELDLGKRFDPDGWYAVLAALAGLTGGGVLLWWRSRDPLLTTLLLLPGAALAAAVMAGTGYLLGPADPGVALAAAKVGARVPEQLSVTAVATYLVWPIAVLTGALMVLWSRPKPQPETGTETSAGSEVPSRADVQPQPQLRGPQAGDRSGERIG